MSTHVTFRQLQVFVAVIRGGAVNAAARHLRLSQSATSQALADLERQLGVVLFERLGRRLELNDAGRRLLPYAEKVLNGLDELVDAVREPDGELRGTLHVAASATIGTYLLPMLAGRFSERHPAVDLQLRLRNTEDVMRDIQRFDADLGLIEGQCSESRLVSELWCQDEMVVVAAPQHPLVTHDGLGVEELQAAQWILREPGSGTRAIFEAAIHPHVERIRVRMELDQHEAIKQAVRAGFGLGCLSRLSVASELERGELVALKSPLQLTRSFSLVWHPERYRSPLWQAFKVFLRESG
ncbi:LysR family transcriptional regulator [Chromohalobacter marismortui]|uniref:LysR family transcriptional regulator n=1 Tax=Chromohalobacter marismortui TaxID=42055 RepID=A0A4V3F4H4_9GAMM|nr:MULTISPECIES: LysR substrate-binding domain-containing protein [Chromohalobacter]MCI0511191.1 LysR substrate-binding domain-containing protein [Chromohalobacter sp.]MCI0593573.1 LysR substrate-binding domain-containing protein [Chromohalobacter sp.]TDU25216.1 LysR family transcriptional regulator [Chromohalobacter marismortui]